MKNYSLEAKGERNGGYVRLKISEGAIPEKDLNQMLTLAKEFSSQYHTDANYKQFTLHCDTMEKLITVIEKFTEAFIQ